MSVEIPLYSWGRLVAHAIVDDEDAPALLRKRWGLYGGYAHATTGGSMHRHVLGIAAPGSGGFVHHVNEDRLDNRRDNLRVFETAAEANAQPHPERDEAAREGGRLYRERMARRQAAEKAA